MQYNEKTLKYYENLKNTGVFDKNLKNVGTGVVGSPLCGDVMKIQLFFDENDKIVDAKYKVFGCVSAIASMELATTIIKGLSIEEALKIKNKDVADSLELTDIKRHCSVLVKESIEAAIQNYLAKNNRGVYMINVTEPALNKIKDLIREHQAVGICIDLISGGCSGIEYSMSYELEDSDKKLKTTVFDITFFFEPENEPFINGLEIDLVQNSFGQGFVINNKNQQKQQCKNCSCGCR